MITEPIQFRPIYQRRVTLLVTDKIRMSKLLYGCARREPMVIAQEFAKGSSLYQELLGLGRGFSGAYGVFPKGPVTTLVSNDRFRIGSATTASIGVTAQKLKQS
jgi:hypothetical protein